MDESPKFARPCPCVDCNLDTACGGHCCPEFRYWFLTAWEDLRKFFGVEEKEE